MSPFTRIEGMGSSSLDGIPRPSMSTSGVDQDVDKIKTSGLNIMHLDIGGMEIVATLPDPHLLSVGDVNVPLPLSS